MRPTLHEKLDDILTNQAEIIRHQRRLEKQMATVADRIGALNADVTALEGEDAAAFARLQAQVAAGQALSPADSATFDALEARLIADANAAKKIAPAPPTPAPAPTP